MQYGFEIVSAKPKAKADEQPTRQPMRAGQKIRRNPSTDQKKVRRLQTKTAAVRWFHDTRPAYASPGSKPWYTERWSVDVPVSASNPDGAYYAGQVYLRHDGQWMWDVSFVGMSGGERDVEQGTASSVDDGKAQTLSTIRALVGSGLNEDDLAVEGAKTASIGRKSFPIMGGTVIVVGRHSDDGAGVRFTIQVDRTAHGGSLETLATSVDWTTASQTIVGWTGDSTEDMLRAALPPWHSAAKTAASLALSSDFDPGDRIAWTNWNGAVGTGVVTEIEGGQVWIASDDAPDLPYPVWPHRNDLRKVRASKTAASLALRDVTPGTKVEFKGETLTVEDVRYSPGGGGRVYVKFVEKPLEVAAPSAHRVQVVSSKTAAGTPKNGDVLIVGGSPGDYYAADPGRRAVIDIGTYGPGTIAATFGASAFRPRDGSYVSVSGGPVPMIDPNDLTYAGRTMQTFWDWNHRGRGAGNGEEYTIEVDMWEWTPPKKTASKTASLTWVDLGRADEGDGDQDADLPGGAWAEIGKAHPSGWTWTILDYDENENVIEVDGGSGQTEDDVKRQVEQWIWRAPTASKTATPNRGHKLMTKEIERKIPPLYSQDGKGKAAVIHVKFFSPYSGWTWYATEYDPSDQIFFGGVVSPMSHGMELGYFALSELEDASGMGGTLPLVERDLYFGTGHTLEDVQSGHTSSRTAAESPGSEISRRLKDWVLGDPNCAHTSVVPSDNSIKPFECSDCGYGLSRQEADAARGQMSLFGSRKTAKVTSSQAEKVLAAVKNQLSAWVDGGGVAPKLVENFDWMGSGHPAPFAIVWEEGPYQWTYLFPYGGIEEEFGFRVKSVEDQVPSGVFCEAITSWALGIYPDGVEGSRTADHTAIRVEQPIIASASIAIGLPPVIAITTPEDADTWPYGGNGDLVNHDTASQPAVMADVDPDLDDNNDQASGSMWDGI